MSDPVFSPDGKLMWTGSEWIPAPPASQSVDVRDSVIMGDVHQETHITSIDGRERKCPNCNSTNVIIMVCQKDECNTAFCEICHRESKLNESAIVDQVHAPGMRFLVPILFNEQGIGPYCIDCITKMVEYRNTNIHQAIEESCNIAYYKAETELATFLDNYHVRINEIHLENKVPLETYLSSAIFLLLFIVSIILTVVIDGGTSFWCGLFAVSIGIVLFFVPTVIKNEQISCANSLESALKEYNSERREYLYQLPVTWNGDAGILSNVGMRIELNKAGFLNESFQVLNADGSIRHLLFGGFFKR
jgi:hypothetical protein